MADVFAAGMPYLIDSLRGNAGVEITYHAGNAQVSSPISATVGQTVFEESDSYGVIVRTESRDYKMTPGDLVIDGEPLEPQAGHLIKEIVGTTQIVSQVMSLGSEGPWKYTSPDQSEMRIHTKEIERVPV